MPSIFGLRGCVGSPPGSSYSDWSYTLGCDRTTSAATKYAVRHKCRSSNSLDGTVDHDVFAGSTMNTVSRETRTMATIAAATPSARKAREQPVQSRATTGYFRRPAATVRPDVWIPMASFKSESAGSPPMVSDLPSAEAQRRVQTDMASGGGA